jgi:predicted GNAT superfamily acetyltransferase
VNEATFDSRGLPVPPPNYISHPSNLILVEIPANFQAVKQKDFALAQRWREHTRHLFEELFLSGFMITDFVYHSGETGEQRSFYLLTHESA